MPRPLLGSAFVLAVTSAAVAQSGWLLRTPPQPPTTRGFHGLAHDIARGVTVMFGGWLTFSTSYLGDTWEWNGATWTQRTPAASPSPRLGCAMAYDLTRGRVVLFGGAVGGGPGTDNDETWEWDGTNWLQLQPAVRPSPRRSAAMTYDAPRSVCVLFGGAPAGAVLDDVWEWDGTNWTSSTPAVRPPARGGCFLVADWARGNVVMHGGSNTTTWFSDTWTWDGTVWQQRAPATLPPPRTNGAGAYDTSRGLVMTSGGSNATGPIGATWLWNGANWRLDPRLPAPPPRWGTAAAYHVGQARIVLFGGLSPGGYQDTWEYEASPPATWSVAGTGCAGISGTPSLAPFGGLPPVLGLTWTLRITYGTGNGFAALAVGTSNQVWIGGALPQDLAALGAPGCTLRTSTEWLGTVTLASGAGAVPWTLPTSPVLAGLPFFAQALVLEAGANPLGGILSNAGAGVLGLVLNHFAPRAAPLPRCSDPHPLGAGTAAHASPG